MSPAVHDVLRNQANRGDAVPTRTLDDAEVSARMIITPARPALVQVYEPKQNQTQEEVILEEFVLDGGETATRDPRSATAAFRFLPLTVEQQKKLEDARRQRLARDGDEDAALALTTGQEGFVTPEANDEMATGRARQAELADLENEPRGTPSKRRGSGGTIRSGTAESETERGADEKKSTTRETSKEATKRGRPKQSSTSSTKRSAKSRK